jgi:hypothetical protein
VPPEDLERPASALPPVRARALAFAAILVAGVAGGLIGSAFVNIQCDGNCTTPSGIGGLVGAVFFAAGVAVISVLVLRAMGEWRSIKERESDQASTSRRNPSA